MAFRHGVHISRSHWFWSAVVVAPMLALSVYFSFKSLALVSASLDSISPIGISLLMLIVSGACFVRAVVGILDPAELELVVENGLIRWGKTGLPTRQKRYALTQIRYVLWEHERSESTGVSLFIEKRILPVSLGRFLQDQGDERALVDYLRTHHPQLRIKER